jgi:hypothetical protein
VLFGLIMGLDDFLQPFPGEVGMRFAGFLEACSTGINEARLSRASLAPTLALFCREFVPGHALSLPVIASARCSEHRMPMSRFLAREHPPLPSTLDKMKVG